MLHKMKSDYGEIAKFFPELSDKLSSSALLIEMARKKKPKPKTGTILYKALWRLTRSDPIFTKKIKQLAPDWLLTGPQLKKRQLLEMARRGEPKPSIKKTKIGIFLYCCMSESSPRHDPAFSKEIMELVPHWSLANRLEIMNQKKQLLLKIAKKKEPRPARKTKIEQALKSYTAKTSSCHDPAFSKEIMELVPHWFVNLRTEVVNHKRQQLLKMARRGEPRPKITSRLGQTLFSYIKKTSGSYNPAFRKKIEKIAPDWLLTGPQLKKQKLLYMARRKKPRPEPGSALYMTLYRFISKKSKSYDPVFAKKIKKLAPPLA